MPDSKGGDDLGVFDDLLKKKEQERAPSQPLISEPPTKGPPSVSPVLAPTEPVDDGGWDEGPSDAKPAVKPADERRCEASRRCEAGRRCQAGR